MIHRALLAAAAAACLLLIAPLAATAVSEDPAAVLAKHKTYVGWAYGDGTLKSARLTVVAERPPDAPTPKPDATPDPLGSANGKRIELRRELLYRSGASRYGFEAGAQGFTGALFWQSNVNGQTVTVRGKLARELLTEDLIDSEALGEAPAAARSETRFDGKNAAVVRIDPKNGVPADLYFDAETGAMLGATIQPDVPLERETLHVVAYSEFAPGKRYVSAWRYGDSKIVDRVTKFEPNVPISDADLHPPAPQATWSFGEPRTVPINIVAHTSPYSNRQARAVHVAVTVNGHPGTFLLDSGAGGLLVFDPLGKVAGLKDLGRTGYSGVNGRGVSATYARVDELTIGGNTLHNVIVTHSAHGGGIDGIIGFDALAGAVFDVDLVTHRLTIHDPNGFDVEPKQGAWAFVPDLSTNHIGVPVKVGNNVLSSVWLDTGDDFFVMFPHELEKKTVALPNEIQLPGGLTFNQVEYYGGVDGSAVEPANCVRLNEIQVGPYRYQKAPACFAVNDAFGSDGGLVGFDFLHHFNWTFDYPHNRVVLTPNGL